MGMSERMNRNLSAICEYSVHNEIKGSDTIVYSSHYSQNANNNCLALKREHILIKQFYRTLKV